MATATTGKKGSHKAGRNKAKCQQYRNLNRRTVNKRKRIARSNGLAFLAVWEKANSIKVTAARAK